MTELEIKSNYRKFALVNLISSGLFLMVAVRIEIVERIIVAIIINLGYFLFYYTLTVVPVNQLKWLKKSNPNSIYSLQKRMLKIYPLAGKIFAVILFILICLKSFYEEEYYSIFAIFIPISMYLGSLLSKIKIERID